MRALLEELNNKSLLGSFHTTIGIGQGQSLRTAFRQRSYEIEDRLISRKWFPELTRLAAFPSKLTGEEAKISGPILACLDQKVAERLHHLQCGIVHAYEDAAARSFSRAKELGIHRSYELPIAHWATSRRLAEEAERFPQWEPTLESTREPEEKLARKEEELALADCITCPSASVLQSIPSEIRKNSPACSLRQPPKIMAKAWKESLARRVN